ncbi:conserved hypothetical protein [Bacillus cereus W]|nr:conserved hypothetical protein [Bacillus cereus W]
MHHMRCEIPHRCVRRKYRIRRHSPFRLRNCWEGRSVRASSLLRQNSSSVPLSLGRTRPCKTTASPVCWKVLTCQLPSINNMVAGNQSMSWTYLSPLARFVLSSLVIGLRIGLSTMNLWSLWKALI